MKTKLNEILIKDAEKLAERGYNDKIICEILNFSKSSLYSPKYLDLLEAIRAKRQEAKDRVMNDLLRRSKEDTSATATIYMANKLKIFETKYKTAKPKTIKEALMRISEIYEDVADGTLTVDKGDKLVSYLSIYIKTFEDVELEQRLQTLEEKLQHVKK